MKTGRSRSFVVGVIALVATGIAWLVAWRLNVDPEPGRLVHAGPRTTVLTEPLLADGSVDYVAWMTAKLREGVTADNDLAPVLSLCLEDPIKGVPPAAGLERPPAPVISWRSWCDDHPLASTRKQAGATEAETDSDPVDPVQEAADSWAACKPDGPHADEMRTWLAAIGPALDLIARESKSRNHWFEPPDRRALAVGRCSHSMRTVVPAFCARAIGRAMDGDLAGAIDDLECARRLLELESPLDDIVALMTRNLFLWRWYVACQAIAEHFERFTCADLRRLEGIGGSFDLERELAAARQVERLRTLHLTFLMMRDPLTVMEASRSLERSLVSTMTTLRDGGSVPAVPTPSAPPPPPSPSRLRASETDRYLELLNARFDEIDAALASPVDWRARVRDVRRIGDEFQVESEREITFFWDFWRKDRPFEEWVRRAPDRSARMLASLGVPMVAKAAAVLISNSADADRARVLCAIACFRNEHGRPPATLDELVPACFDAPPLDRICRTPMVLTVNTDGELDVTSEALTLAARIKADWDAYVHGK